MKKKSDMKTYKNVQICYEMETWEKTPLLAQKSSRSEKPEYPNPDLKNLHLKKRSNGLQTKKMSGRLD